jgi:hypothetical protein
MLRIVMEAVLACCSVLSLLNEDILRKIVIKPSITCDRERIEMETS